MSVDQTRRFKDWLDKLQLNNGNITHVTVEKFFSGPGAELWLKIIQRTMTVEEVRKIRAIMSQSTGSENAKLLKTKTDLERKRDVLRARIAKKTEECKALVEKNHMELHRIAIEKPKERMNRWHGTILSEKSTLIKAQLKSLTDTTANVQKSEEKKSIDGTDLKKMIARLIADKNDPNQTINYICERLNSKNICDFFSAIIAHQNVLNVDLNRQQGHVIDGFSISAKHFLHLSHFYASKVMNVCKLQAEKAALENDSLNRSMDHESIHGLVALRKAMSDGLHTLEALELDLTAMNDVEMLKEALMKSEDGITKTTTVINEAFREISMLDMKSFDVKTVKNIWNAKHKIIRSKCAMNSCNVDLEEVKYFLTIPIAVMYENHSEIALKNVGNSQLLVAKSAVQNVVDLFQMSRWKVGFDSIQNESFAETTMDLEVLKSKIESSQTNIHDCHERLQQILATNERILHNNQMFQTCVEWWMSFDFLKFISNDRLFNGHNWNYYAQIFNKHDLSRILEKYQK